MGRRRKKRNDIGWVVLIGTLLALALILQAAEQQPGVLVLIIAGAGLVFATPFYLNKRASNAVGKKLSDAIDNHISALSNLLRHTTVQLLEQIQYAVSHFGNVRHVRPRPEKIWRLVMQY
jgi:hypothetical protein